MTAAGCFGVSLLHVGLALAGVAVNRFFGAPPRALRMIAERSPVVYLMIAGIAVLFLVFGLYALSGAAVLRRLPLQRTVLVGLGLLLVLRGLSIVDDVRRILSRRDYSAWQFPVMSLASLLLGVSALVGVSALLKSQPRDDRGKHAA